MKTKFIILAGLFSLLVIIFTSCSTSVEVAKRQFNNGYYVHVNTNKHKAEIVSVVKRDGYVNNASNTNIEPTPHQSIALLSFRNE